MYTAAGITTLIIAALVGTVIGNLVQLRYLLDKPIMKSPFIRYGSLVLAVVIIIMIIPDPTVRLATGELLSYGLWWVLIAFLVSFVRPPTPIAPRKDGNGTAEVEAVQEEASLPDEGKGDRQP